MSVSTATDPWVLLRASSLWRSGGLVRTRLTDPAVLTALQREADAQHRFATEVHREAPVDEDTRRGDPARWLESAPGGRHLAAFLAAPTTLHLLRTVTGLPFVPSGQHGSYSYYRRAGHHLGVHRDVDICDLAVITCLRDEGARPGDRALEAYPDRWSEPVSHVRADPARGARPVPLAPGESAVLLGGLVPHCVPPVGPGRVRVVAPTCYRVATG